MARSKTKRRLIKNKKILFVEGETEKNYFNQLKQNLRLSNIDVVNKYAKGPNCVEDLKKYIKNKSIRDKVRYDDVFVVFDKDDITNEQLDTIFKNAKDEDIKVGFSNKMFEVWLLAHFETITKGLLNSKQLQQKISKYLGCEYKKSDISQLDKIVIQYERAIENAKDVSKIDYDKQCTNIGELIKNLIS